MGIFDKIKGPVFLKHVPEISQDVIELTEILKDLDEAEKPNILAEIKKYEYGHSGEKSIEFELKHAGIPMIIIPDLYLVHNDLSAQIDFLVITRNSTYIIECKNLYGDIHVGNGGEFLRKIGKGTQKIYSPFTQCQRHTQVVKNIREETKHNILTKFMFEQNFEKTYKSIVVFANNSCKVNTKYAPEHMKNQIISADQLVEYLKERNNPKEYMLEKYFEKLGDFFLSQDRENPKNYMDKYRKVENNEVNEPIEELEAEEAKICTRCGSSMVLRTATRGDNKGNQFYGCSSYPKCRYIEKFEKDD